uniref:Uncharacterized protein n=1 Tax=Fervidicoccus fontis TaxID=683846 RepID=A0A7J3ZL77_9CREN
MRSIDPRKLEDALERRHEIAEEIMKLIEALKSGGTDSDRLQEEILALYESYVRHRKSLQRMLSAAKTQKLMRESGLREYISTLIDYFMLVDLEVEKDLLESLLQHASSRPGALNKSLEELIKEAAEVQLLSEVQKGFYDFKDDVELEKD